MPTLKFHTEVQRMEEGRSELNVLSREVIKGEVSCWESYASESEET